MKLQPAVNVADPEAYGRFLLRLFARCQGKVQSVQLPLIHAKSVIFYSNSAEFPLHPAADMDESGPPDLLDSMVNSILHQRL
ncbi:hypothetical protein D3C73_1339420 [compost metagenome]